MTVVLECGECGNPQASLEAMWGAHHGQYRVSLYQCTGYGTERGCGAMGVEVFDQDHFETTLMGCLERGTEVPAETMDG